MMIIMMIPMNAKKALNKKAIMPKHTSNTVLILLRIMR